MKWKVTSEAGLTFAVDVPDSFKSGLPAIGEPFVLQYKSGSESDTNSPLPVRCQFMADGKSLMVGNRIIRIPNRPVQLKKSKMRLRASCLSVTRDHNFEVRAVRPVEPILTAAALGGGAVRAPMTGKVLKVLVQNGQLVSEGTVLLIIEAMKMENQIRAECSGTIEGIRVKEGDGVSVDSTLLTLNPARDVQP
jgi:biotin carboxyl carrier protein